MEALEEKKDKGNSALPHILLQCVTGEEYNWREGKETVENYEVPLYFSILRSLVPMVK